MALQAPTITLRTRIIDGVSKTDYRINCGSAHGKKQVFFRQTEADAKKCVEEQHRLRKRLGAAVAALTPAQVYDAATALQRLNEAGHELSLYEVVRRWLESSAAPTATGVLPLGQAWEKYYARFTESQKRHRQTVKGTVRRFILAWGLDRQLGSVARADLDGYLRAFPSPKTFNNHIGCLHSFFQWTVDQELLRVNPAAKIERKAIAYKEPEWMRGADVERLLRAAANRKGAEGFMPRMILGFFCGLRTAEIDRADWSQVNWEESEVRVAEPKGHTNGQKPRLVHLEPNALAWLALYRKDAGKVSISAKHFMEHMAVVCKETGMLWPSNVMRHTYATMHVAMFRDPARTAMEMGHEKSARTMNAHYKGLATQAEATKYWGIMPLKQEKAAHEESGHDIHGANSGVDAGVPAA